MSISHPQHILGTSVALTSRFFDGKMRQEDTPDQVSKSGDLIGSARLGSAGKDSSHIHFAVFATEAKKSLALYLISIIMKAGKKRIIQGEILNLIRGQWLYSLFKVQIHYQKVDKEINALREFLAPHGIPAKSAIDIGCGDGRVTLRLKELFELDCIWGLDLNKNLLGLAHKRGVKPIHGDMNCITFEGKFDLVICYGALHHSDNIKVAISNMKKLTSGYLLIVDNTIRRIFFHSITGSKHFIFESSPYRIRSREEILNSLMENDCRVLSVRTYPNACIWHDRTFFLAKA